jgi:dCMP deaminase
MKLAKTSGEAKGATIFITHAPCIECAKMIYQAGIVEVYYGEVYRSFDGISFLEKCNIPVKHFPRPPSEH